jgi:hypothetical protein
MSDVSVTPPPAAEVPDKASVDPTEEAIDARIAEARGNLTARLGELERRVDNVKESFDPRTWVDSPWLRLGITVAIGYGIGRSRMLRPLVKTLVGTAATALVRRALAGGT